MSPINSCVTWLKLSFPFRFEKSREAIAGQVRDIGSANGDR